ncbi:MAG TPA: hypothetical protein VFB01_15855 [Burkholderiales bacterium]|nr:hypothetical protein [Burkholderiales bacterium]
MEHASATGDITALILSTESHRRETARQHSANIAALKREIVRINALAAGDAGSRATAAGRPAGPRTFGQHDPFRSFPRSKGRRTMGRGER